MFRPSYVSWFGHPINGLWGLQIINRGYEADVFNFTKKEPLSVEYFQLSITIDRTKLTFIS
jgi:hypothetical protein